MKLTEAIDIVKAIKAGKPKVPVIDWKPGRWWPNGSASLRYAPEHISFAIYSGDSIGIFGADAKYALLEGLHRVLWTTSIKYEWRDSSKYLMIGQVNLSVAGLTLTVQGGFKGKDFGLETDKDAEEFIKQFAKVNKFKPFKKGRV